MSFESDFLNFCLSCDKHMSSEEPYCSQACRFADLEKSDTPLGSTPDSPTLGFHFTSAMPALPQTGFVLPPAVDFSSYRRPSSPATGSVARPSRSSSSSSNTLSIDTSRPSSVSWSASSMSTPTQGYMSAAAREELRRYESLFESTRSRSERR